LLTTSVYDAAGNRLRSGAIQPKTYTYDAANQIRTVRNPYSTTATSYVYDAAGNLLSQGPGSSPTYKWDAENRLTEYTPPGGGIVKMVYRADGLRVYRESTYNDYPNGPRNFIWDQQRLLMETDTDGVTRAAYTLAPGEFGPLVSQRRGGSSWFYELDGLGSVVGLTQGDQSETDAYSYDAFGFQIGEDWGVTVNRFRYVGSLGYYLDDNYCTYYYVRARYYEFYTARWLSWDPIGLAAGDPNLYTYVANAPLNRTDASGEAVSRYTNAYERCMKSSSKIPDNRAYAAAAAFCAALALAISNAGSKCNEDVCLKACIATAGGSPAMRNPCAVLCFAMGMT
jgi:RHS repeat-associated protein